MKNKDIDLMKIQVLDSSYHAWFTVMSSVLVSGIIGMLILVATLYYEKTFNYLAFYIAIGLLSVFIFVGFRVLANNLNAHLDFMNDLLKKIEEGKQLPSLTELGKKTKAKK